MRCFIISSLFAVLGILIGSAVIHWIAMSSNSINTDLFVILGILPPCLGIAIACVFFCEENWGNTFSLKNVCYSTWGALFGALGWYLSFIIIARAFYFKHVGTLEISLLQHVLDPSTLPPLLEQRANGTSEIRPTLGRCFIGFIVGLFSTGFNISYLWNNYGIKRQLQKIKSEAACLICGEGGFIRQYEHRIFHTVGAASYSKSYLFPLPFCEACWANITSKRFWIMKILVLLGTLGGIFAIIYCFDVYNLFRVSGLLFPLCIFGLPISAYFLYQHIKRQERKHCKFRISTVDDHSGVIVASVWDEEKDWQDITISIHPKGQQDAQ